jgi:hypothetical protein
MPVSVPDPLAVPLILSPLRRIRTAPLSKKNARGVSRIE